MNDADRPFSFNGRFSTRFVFTTALLYSVTSKTPLLIFECADRFVGVTTISFGLCSCNRKDVKDLDLEIVESVDVCNGGDRGGLPKGIHVAKDTFRCEEFFFFFFFRGKWVVCIMAFT
ncbi:MAG: hypothetical protein ACTSUE_14470 [Promethearchaeota archaeon]